MFSKMKENEKKLQLSATDYWISGVCGGIGKKFDIDSDLIRIITVLLFLCPGVPVGIVYIILWMCMPSEKENEE